MDSPISIPQEIFYTGCSTFRIVQPLNIQLQSPAVLSVEAPPHSYPCSSAYPACLGSRS